MHLSAGSDSHQVRLEAEWQLPWQEGVCRLHIEPEEHRKSGMRVSLLASSHPAAMKSQSAW